MTCSGRLGMADMMNVSLVARDETEEEERVDRLVVLPSNDRLAAMMLTLYDFGRWKSASVHTPHVPQCGSSPCAEWGPLKTARWAAPPTEALQKDEWG